MWNRVRIGGIEVPLRALSLTTATAPVSLGAARPPGYWRGSIGFELTAAEVERTGLALVEGAAEGIESDLFAGALLPHPTDVIAERVRLDLRSIVPAEVQRGMDLSRRWARRLRRREARSGTVGRRGARVTFDG